MRSPPTASLQLGLLPRLVRVWSLRGLCRLPPPGDPNALNCPGVLDACSRAAVLNSTYLLGLPVRGEGAVPVAGVVRPPQLERGCQNISITLKVNLINK